MEKNKISQIKTENAKKIASRLSASKNAYDSLEESVLKFFRWVSGIIDKLFFSKKYAPIFALFLTFLMYFVATYDDSSTLTSSKVLNNISVNAKYNSESFELSGLPTACEIVFTGDASSVTNATAKKGYCQIDLNGYAEGTHTVKMNAVGYGDNVSTIVSPSEVSITLKKKTTMQFDLTYDFINRNSMDAKYMLGEPQFAQGSKINIRASQDTLDSIALVKALIDVGGASGEIKVDAPIVAYDKNGKAIVAEIVPDKVNVTVPVTSDNTTVNVVLKPIGDIPNGIAIDDVQIVDEYKTTKIYGPKYVLDSVSEVYVNFDMSTITENAVSELFLPIVLPSGVNASDVNLVKVIVTLTSVESKTFENIPLNFENNVNNLAISSDIDFKEVNVIAQGSANNLSKVDPQDIYVSFDMPEEPGTYDLPLKVKSDLNPFIKFELEKSTVHVTVVEAN